VSLRHGLTDRKSHSAGGNADKRRSEKSGARYAIAIMKTLSPTMNGKAYIASMKISQQNKPMPAKFREVQGRAWWWLRCA